jgi:N-acetylneuraminic acid mutarotase
MPAARGQTYGVTIGDYFYVFGGSTGFTQTGASDSVYRYDRTTGVWDSPTTMPYLAKELTAHLLPNGFIHVAGGVDGGGSYKNFSYWYDPYANTWTAKSNLPVTWVDGRVGNLPDGRTIIFGGSINGNGARVTLAYIYDPDLDTYTLAASLPVAVGNHVAATMADGRIVSVSGVLDGNNINSLKTQIFDPSTMSWSLGADQPVAHGNYSGVAATPCGPVYLWGGALAGSADTVFHGIKTVSAYNPNTNTWSVIDDLPFFASHGAYGRFYDGQYIHASGHNNSAMTAKTYLSATPIVE